MRKPEHAVVETVIDAFAEMEEHTSRVYEELSKEIDFTEPSEVVHLHLLGMQAATRNMLLYGILMELKSRR
jgi:rubrerythrin